MTSDGSFSPRAREAIALRGHELCQRCRGSDGLACHHRLPRRMGGTSRDLIGHPANGVLLCRVCHDWVESHRQCALEQGLLLHAGADPREQPMWLLLPYGAAWYRVDDEGLVHWVHDRLDPPDCNS